MIDRISGRIALLLVVIACLFVVILGWFVLISPQRSKATKLDGQIDDVNTQLVAVTALLDSPAGRESLVSQRLFDKALPTDPKVSQIIRQLTAISAQAGVELDSLTPGALVPGAGVESLPIALAVKGHYFALQKFFKLLNSSADLSGDQVKASGRLFSIDNIGFAGGAATTPAPGQAASASSSNGSVINATVSLNAYVYSPTSVAPAPVAPTTTTDTGSTTTP
jgi:hypothetical protein